MQELIALDERQSLESLGLFQVQLHRDRRWRIPQIFRDLGFNDEESWSLLSELLRSLRHQGVLDMPEGVDPRDEAFNPRRGPIYVREDGSETARKVLSWLPTRGVNRRLDYVRRVLQALGSDTDPEKMLRGCWRAIVSWPDPWLTTDTVRQLGTVRQIDHTWLRLAPTQRAVYRCKLCQRITSVSVRDVWPTLGCQGALAPFTVPPAEQDDNHYRALYGSMNPVPMIAREHTAQLTTQEAAGIQQQFLRGQVNVLSCSTTFELGVDVGELQSVMLRNMPPTTANYVQRTGRAGRRADSAALVVTYAQRRSHDLSRYNEPASMIAGEIRTLRAARQPQDRPPPHPLHRAVGLLPAHQTDHRKDLHNRRGPFPRRPRSCHPRAPLPLPSPPKCSPIAAARTPTAGPTGDRDRHRRVGGKAQ